MDFYYPNPINDFWRIMGLIYRGDKDAFYIPSQKTFRLPEIKQLLTDHHIALSDTGREIRRLQGNASDKFLEIVTPIDLEEMLTKHPTLSAVATTGQKAAEVIAEITDTPVPKVGEKIITEYASRPLRIYRMPSTSRAYPLNIAKKAAAYEQMLREETLL